MEQLLVLLVLILIPLANFLLDRIRRRQEPPAEQRRRADMGMRRQAPHEPVSYEAFSPEPPPEIAGQTVIPRTDSRRRRAGFLRNPREVRRAVIAMTILGPCRANEPRD